MGRELKNMVINMVRDIVNFLCLYVQIIDHIMHNKKLRRVSEFSLFIDRH